MSWNFNTIAIHAGRPNEEITGSITLPIFQTSTFGQREPGVFNGFNYSRTANPTRKTLEDNLAALEGGRFAVSLASGMAAVNTCLNLLKAGDHVVACRDLYGGSYRIFTKVFSKFGVEFSLIDASNLDEIRAAIRPNTRLVWLETPSNPLLKIVDLEAAIGIAREHNIRTVVDNTFATPVLQHPLSLGADVVLHSTTKYINGHGDVIGGALITNDEEIAEELKFYQNAVGAIPGPQDCFLILRGISTLGIRVQQHCRNARRIAEHLSTHPAVRHVYYPGLETHPGHNIARRQMDDFGAMVSIELNADIEATKRFASSTRLFTLAESLGATKSLVNHSATMTHASVEPEVRRSIGLSDGLIRLSVGLEDAGDLIDDLEAAFERARISAGARAAAHV